MWPFTHKRRILQRVKQFAYRVGAGSYSATVGGTAPKAKAYADEGFGQNVIVFRCVDIIAKSLAGLPLLFQNQNGDDLPPAHPFRRLLEKPNPSQGWGSWAYEAAAFRLITGDSFMEAETGGDVTHGAVQIVPAEDAAKPPVFLWNWAPFQMEMRVGGRMVKAYVWKEGAGRREWLVDQMDGLSNLLHWKSFNPLDPWRGMSPLRAAGADVDQHNDAGKWNAALLQNGGEPGLLVKVMHALSDDQFRQFQGRINSDHTGPRNARKHMVVDDAENVEIDATAWSPKDMDWLDGRRDAGRAIAGAFGVPTQVIPIQGDQTFANYEQARLALYEDTVIPLANDFLRELSEWIGSRYPDQPRVLVDVDAVPALEAKRSEKWSAVQGADWLSTNEKREVTGYAPIDAPEADEILVPAGKIPLTLDPAAGAGAEGEGGL